MKCPRCNSTETNILQRYLSLLAVALATGHAYVAYDPEKEEPGDELGDPSIWGYEEKVTLISKRSAAGDTTDANEEVGTESTLPTQKGVCR